MEAIVLAGGFGTRLRHIVSDVPKPMARVCERPFLEYILDNICSCGVNRVILAVGYQKEVVKDHFGNRYKNIDLVYSEEETPLGTGGAIKKALKECNEKNVFVINGDTYIDVKYRDFLNFHKEKKSDLTIAIKLLKNFDRYGTVQTMEGRIVSFSEKRPQTSGYINTGAYVINKSLLDSISLDVFSFENDFMEKKIEQYNFNAFITEGYFIDIGIPEDYFKAQADFNKQETVL